MAARRGRGSAEKTGFGHSDEVKTLKVGRLPAADRRRIERIVRWEEESNAADFLIRTGPFVVVGRS